MHHLRKYNGGIQRSLVLVYRKFYPRKFHPKRQRVRFNCGLMTCNDPFQKAGINSAPGVHKITAQTDDIVLSVARAIVVGMPKGVIDFVLNNNSAIQELRRSKSKAG